MAETNLAFSKIVSTPTPTAWSQAYSAGTLFAAFSLESGEPLADDGLNSIGKELISTFESEFFTLENKDLDSIKEAVTTTLSRISEDIKVSTIVCFLSEDVLYLFSQGGSRAILKRKDKIGTVLEGIGGREIKVASGYVEDKDLIVLQTSQFLKIITPSVVAAALDSNKPEDIAEELSPSVHERAEGGAASVILVYSKEQLKKEAAAGVSDEVASEIKEVSEEKAPQTEEEEEEKEQNEDVTPKEELPTEQQIPPLNKPLETTDTKTAKSQNGLASVESSRSRRRLSGSSLSLGSLKGIGGKIPRQRRTIAVVAVILGALIIIVSFLAINNMRSAPTGNFDEIYAEASTKYEEGLSLKDLNPSLAQDSFRQSQGILEANKDTFKEGSDENRQIEELLTKVTSEITGDGGKIEVSQVSNNESKLLSVEIENPKATYFTENNSFIHYITGLKVVRLDKGNSEEEEIIEEGFSNAAGIGTFGSNVYILDKKAGIIKFVPTKDGYSDTKYLKGDTPDFSNAASMAIDGAVYVLGSDGTISKFLRGESESFDITGLTKPLSSPTRIFTNEDSDNLYVLDKGNSRIVILSKDGEFINSFTADVIKNAVDFDVDEAGGKIFVLSGNKIYQIDTN